MTERRKADVLLTGRIRQALLDEGLQAEVTVSGDGDVDGALARTLDRVRSGAAAEGAVGSEAGVSHEVRNVMTGVLGFTQVALRKLASEPQEVRGLLVQAEQEVLRCVEMLTRFLTRARPVGDVRHQLDLGRIADEVRLLVDHQLSAAGITLDVQVADGVPAVNGDASALKQVVLNLVLNAIHATRGLRGRIQVVVTHEGGDAVLRVRDEGPGVMPADVDRIFEPFYTTKPPGEGTGLGLAVSREIVETHGGTLVIEASDIGAVFRLRLPACGE